MLSLDPLLSEGTRLVWILWEFSPPENLKRFLFPNKKTWKQVILRICYAKMSGFCSLPKCWDIRLYWWCAWLCFTLRETQQQVRTRLCSSDSSTRSSPSPRPPPDAWAIRELMAFPISQKEGGASKTEASDLLCGVINRSEMSCTSSPDQCCFCSSTLFSGTSILVSIQNTQQQQRDILKQVKHLSGQTVV